MLLKLDINELRDLRKQFEDFINRRIYDQEEIQRQKHFEQIILERYSHEVPKQIVEIQNTALELNDLKNHVKEVYVKEERKKMVGDVEQIVYIYNQQDDNGNFLGNKIYKEDFFLIQMRVQKKIQTGILGLGDEKNKEYVEETPFIKRLRKVVNSRKGGEEISEYLKELAKLFLISIKNMYWMPSSPFMFNQLKLRISDNENDLYLVKYKDIDAMTFDDWMKIYETKDYQYGSCYSMGSIEDNLEQIYDMLKTQQLIFKHQGGFGQNFSKLRSKYQKVKSINCNSTGQLSFMKPFNNNTELVQLTQNTKRGQNMIILDIDHPEIVDFIDQKTDFDKGYKNFQYQNLSVNFKEEFFEKLFNGEEFELVDPSDDSIRLKEDSRKLWNKILLNATLHSEPGVLNLDIINEDNPLRGIEDITSVNPCVVGDTRVLTEEGLVRQDQLQIGMKVFSQTSGEFHPINETYNNGIKDIYELKLENGQKILQTPEHKVFVIDGETNEKKWKEVKELTTKDRVFYLVDNVADGFKPKRKFDQEHLGRQYLYGTIFQNGRLTITRQRKRKTMDILDRYIEITIDRKRTDVINQIKNYIEGMNLKYRMATLPDRVVIVIMQFDVVINDRNMDFVRKVLLDFGIDDEAFRKDEKREKILTIDANNIKIPEFIYRSDGTVMKYFLAGFLDNVNFNFDNLFFIRNIDMRRLEEIQFLFSVNGIRTKIMDDKRMLFLKDTNRELKKLSKYVRYGVLKRVLDEYVVAEDKIYTNEEIEKMNFLKVEHVIKRGQEVVYDIKVEPHFEWVTNGILSYDCQEFNGQDKSVCVLGSLNLYQFLDKNYELDFELLSHQAKVLHTFLTISNFQNDFPLKELTHNTRRFRNTGLGYMGLQSILLLKEIEYGSKEQYEFFKKIMKTITRNVLENSVSMADYIGGYDKFELNKNLYTGDELNKKFNTTQFDPNVKYYLLNNNNPETQIELQEDKKVQNQRMMQVAPTGCRVKEDKIEVGDNLYLSYSDIIFEQFDFNLKDLESGKYIVFQRLDREKNKIVWDKIKKDDYVIWYVNNTDKYIRQDEIEEGYFIRKRNSSEIIQVLYLITPKRFYMLNEPVRIRINDKEYDIQKRFYYNGFEQTYVLYGEQNGYISECSSEHKWMIYNNKSKRFEWVKTEDIKIGDLILTKYGLDKIMDIVVDEGHTYDLEVINRHFYFTEKGFYSHNSISYLCGVSSGVEPIFSLQYERRINPNMQNEYKVVITDRQLVDYIKNKLDVKQNYKEIIDEILKTGSSKYLKNKNFIKTIENVSVQEKLLMLHVSNSFIDMNTSTTFNIQIDKEMNDAELEKLNEVDDPFIKQALEKYKKVRFDVNIDEILLTDKQQLKQTLNFIKKNLCQDEMCINRIEVMFDLAEEGKFNEQLLKELKSLNEFKNFIKLLQQVNDFYLLTRLMKIKGTTIYVEGSRTPILSRVGKKKNKKSSGSEFILNIGNKEINLDDRGFIRPRKRPSIIQSLKKTVKFKLNGDEKEKKFHIEIGFDNDTNEPFEVFFRPTESTKDLTEFFNLQGRLLSTLLRQGLNIDDQIKQIKKVKTWRNEYSPIARIMGEVIEELIDLNKQKGKKRKEMIEKKEDQKEWVLTGKGYYIDTEGKKRCPVCGEIIYEKDGCIECLSCGWTQCVDN